MSQYNTVASGPQILGTTEPFCVKDNGDLLQCEALSFSTTLPPPPQTLLRPPPLPRSNRLKLSRKHVRAELAHLASLLSHIPFSLRSGWSPQPNAGAILMTRPVFEVQMKNASPAVCGGARYGKAGSTVIEGGTPWTRTLSSSIGSVSFSSPW